MNCHYHVNFDCWFRSCLPGFSAVTLLVFLFFLSILCSLEVSHCIRLYSGWVEDWIPLPVGIIINIYYFEFLCEEDFSHLLHLCIYVRKYVWQYGPRNIHFKDWIIIEYYLTYFVAVHVQALAFGSLKWLAQTCSFLD